MGFLSKIILDSALGLSGEKPLFGDAACINRRQRRYTCSVCIELCPQKVFSLDPKVPIRAERCDNCSLCVSACPSRCFAPSPGTQRLYAENADLSKPVCFSCMQDQSGNGKRVSCLASIPWELLAACSLFTQLHLYTGNCQNCDSARSKLLKNNLTVIQTFLGADRFAENVRLHTDEKPDEAGADKRMTRREIFSGLRRSATKSAHKAVVTRLPFLAESEEDGMLYRRLLAGAADRDRTAAAANGQALPLFGVRVPQFTIDCFGCGVCEKLCPQKAIQIGAEENGKRLIFLTPWKCSACGLCKELCPYKGILGMHIVQAPHLNRLALVRIESASCAQCGVAVPPERTYCPACAAKKRL